MTTLPIHVSCPGCKFDLISSSQEFSDGDIYTCTRCDTPIKIHIREGHIIGYPVNDLTDIIGHKIME